MLLSVFMTEKRAIKHKIWPRVIWDLRARGPWLLQTYSMAFGENAQKINRPSFTYFNPQLPSWGALLPSFPCLLCLHIWAIILLLCMWVCGEKRSEEGCAIGKDQADSWLVHGLPAQWREDDVEPWRKCPHLRQSSCACPSRLAAQDHPFQQPPTPCISAHLSSHILLLWGMGCDTRPGYSPLLKLVTVEALLLTLPLSSDVTYKYIPKHKWNMHILYVYTLHRSTVQHEQQELW